MTGEAPSHAFVSLVLLGFVPQDALQWVVLDRAAVPLDLSALEGQRVAAQQAIVRTRLRLPDVQPITGPADYLAELARHPHLRTYERAHPRFQLVEIAPLVAMQYSVYTHYGPSTQRPPAPGDADALLRYTLPLRVTHEYQVTILPGGQHVWLLNRKPGPYLGAAQIRDVPETGAREIVFPIDQTVNWAKVLFAHDRAILMDGTHRLYRLAAAGVTHAPVLCLDAPPDGPHLPRGTAAAEYELISGDVVLSARPPLISDFATAAAVALPVNPVLHQISVAVQDVQIPYF